MRRLGKPSTAWVLDNFDVGKRLFAFPFTDFGVGKRFFNYMSKNGNLDLSFGTAGLKRDAVKTNLQRIPMENGLDARDTLFAEYFYYALKSLVGKNRINRKTN